MDGKRKKKSKTFKQSVAFIKESTRDLKNAIQYEYYSECFFINGKHIYLQQ
jgi:hypothetical protein